MTDPLTVAFLPVYQNPYQHLLTAALGKLDVQVLHLAGMPSAAWLWRERSRVQVLHFHWLSGLYMGRYLTPFTWLRFLARFAMACRLGYRIVWTAHNILPHRMPFPPIHLAVRRLMMAQADAVIVHCEYGMDELLRQFPRTGPVHVIPIGSYRGVYPATASRAEARAWLGLHPDQFVYLFLGNIAPYKGLEGLVDSFSRLATEDDVLVIAGRRRGPALVRWLEERAANDPRLCLYAGFIPDSEMQFFLHGADVMVAPFRKVLTSSSVIVGMDHGLPIIAPAMGCLPELVTPDAGVLYDPADPEALGKALRRIKSMDTAKMGRAAREIAAALCWDDIARRTAQVYQECLT